MTRAVSRATMASMAYRKGRYSQVARALRILDLLRGHRHGVQLADLAEAVKISVSQVRRDLQALEEAGHSIDYPQPDGRAGARLLEKSYSEIPITRRERYMLLAVRRMFDVLRDTPFYEDIESVIDKLNDRLPAGARAELETFNDRFVYVPDGGTKPYGGKLEVLDALQTGVMERKIVRYVYRQARGQEQRGLLAPYALAIYKHGLYVVGRRLKQVEDGMTPPPAGTPPGVFAAERFVEADFVPRTTFVVPPDFRIEKVFQGAFGLRLGHAARAPEKVVIEFSALKRSLVEARVWHPSQRIEHLPDGRLHLEFECPDPAEVVTWVLGWGPYARVIAPSFLVERVASELRQAAALYAAPPATPEIQTES